MDKKETESLIEGRGRCAFCGNRSDYVLELSDPAPGPEKVIESEIALPICRNHLSDVEDANLNV